jgi:two-component system sensor histidine kinase AgrC
MNNTICYFFSHFMEAIILWQYTSNLFPPVQYNLKLALSVSDTFNKKHAQKRIHILIFLYIFLFVISIAEIKWLNATSYFLVNLIYLLTQCRLKYFPAIFHSAILTAVMSACELLLYSIISHYTTYFFSESFFPKNLVILSVSSKILNFLVIHILIWLLKGKTSDNASQTLSAFLLSLIPITSIIVIITFVSIGENTTLPHNLDWMTTLSATLLLGINLLVFGLNQYNQKKYAEYTETLLLLQKEADTTKYYEMLLSQHDNQSILIHDIKKHLQSIDLLNDQHDHEKISAYIKQLLLSSDLKETVRLCDHALLNAILCRYKTKCLSLQISFLADIRSGAADFMADNDITSLFCNLLDNAVEACTNIPEAFIEMTARKREHTPFVVITIVNSCRRNPFSEGDALKNRMPFTNKPDKRKHGFGIKSIRKVVSKYHGDIQMYYKDDAPAFHTIITLKYKTAEYG